MWSVMSDESESEHDDQGAQLGQQQQTASASTPGQQQKRPDPPEEPNVQREVRRQGLPVRILVNRVGDMYERGEGYVSSQGDVVAAVADALHLRKVGIGRDARALRASQSRSARSRVVHYRNLVILTASLQLEVMDEMFVMWAGREGVRWLRIIESQGSCTSQAQVVRKMKEHWKTHCFYVYGGEIWLKFLIAIGDVCDFAIGAVNHNIDVRSFFKRHKWADREPSAPDSHHFLRRHHEHAKV